MSFGMRLGLAMAIASLALLIGCGHDDSGGTIADAATERGFYFGVALADATSADAQTVVPAHFNSISAENAMKWGELANTVGNYDFRRADAFVELAQRSGVRLRGHALLWRDQTPSDLAAQIDAASDPEARMREVVEEHFRTVLTRYRGQVETWDVVNEPLELFGNDVDANIFYRTLGPGYIAEVFRLAHELDPEARLCLNEALLTYVEDNARTDALVALVQGLVEEGVPLHVVGLQGHFTSLNAAPQRARIEALLHRFTELGVDVELTELDISVRYFSGPTPFDEQAVAYADVTSACLAVDGCRSITVWGVRDDESWLDTYSLFRGRAPHTPLLFDAALAPKPAYTAVRDALRVRR